MLPIPSTKPDLEIDDEVRGDFFDTSLEEDENLIATGLWDNEESDEDAE